MNESHSNRAVNSSFQKYGCAIRNFKRLLKKRFGVPVWCCMVMELGVEIGLLESGNSWRAIIFLSAPFHVFYHACEVYGPRNR